jgi:hypothetical protein
MAPGGAASGPVEPAPRRPLESRLGRRDWLLSAGMLAIAVPFGAARAAPRATTLAAAWDDREGRHHAGLVGAAATEAPLRVLQSIELPTRAHGVWVEAGGSLLVAARRPGDWLLRWWPGRAAPQWCWSEPERRYAGHVVTDPAGRRLYTTETDLDSGAGRIVVRDIRSLEPVADWPSHGIDPHQLMFDADGSLLVANGGVPTRPETGRVKLDRAGMDPSLVRLDPHDGRRLGQWRLDDPRLSIRHLARHAGGTVGIALQAEHDDDAARAAAPLLALFDGRTLRCAEPGMPLAGYGGDIAATAEGYAVGATRAGGIARWRRDGRWLGLTPLADACPLTMHDDELWAGGSARALQRADAAPRAHEVTEVRLDNHWAAWRTAR